jgi:hypothetical protein
MSIVVDQSWLDRSNRDTYYHIERQGRTDLGIVPFLGAGISRAFGLKDWKGLLLDAAPPHLSGTVENHINKGEYEQAAETLLTEFGSDGFQNMVAASAGDSNLETFDFRAGVVALLPLLTNGPVVTTNFDRVLERAFEADGTPFDSVISGPRPDLIVDALHGNRHVLIKLHGDWQDRVGRTFTKSDYDANYGKGQPEQKRELLEGVERLIFSSRSLLFIGASLGPDRTVKLLQRVHKRYAGIRHFAIMNAPAKQEEFKEKEQHLRTCGILPLWYLAKTSNDHIVEVRRMVSTIVERISVKTVSGPTVRSDAPPPCPPVSMVVLAPAPPERPAHFKRVARLVEDGRISFFLGSAIHDPVRLTAKEFYEDLARIFECEALGEDRFAVAQFIADRHGREDLDAEIRKLLARTPFQPQATHEFFAAWREFRTQAGQFLPYPMIFTTNYDDVLENRLASARLPYHLFSYQSDGASRGRFYHQSVDDSLRIIERPRNLRELSDGFVVVKMNGGIDRRRRIPDSFATTRLDFWDLAARIPDVLPAVIQEKLLATRLLFLGHGLAVADVESLVRFAHKDHPGPRSWAVVLGKGAVEYWRQCGVTIINQPVSVYVNLLRERLLMNGPVPGAAVPASVAPSSA